MDPQSTAALQQGQVWVALIAAATSIIGTAITLYTQARNRRWDKEDAAEREAKIARGLEEVKDRTTQQHREVKQAIEDNTSLTAWAADKAALAINQGNNFERKWEVIEKIFAASNPVVATAKEQHEIVTHLDEGSSDAR
jgi:hypothetical protein